MPPDQTFTIDPTISKLLPAVLGSVVSLRFLPGTWPERLLMLVGGTALSYYSAPAASEWLGVAKAEGAIGFLLGLFGMGLVAGAYEVLQLVDRESIAKALRARLEKIIGG